MTKCPEINSPIDEELKHVIEVVRKCVQDEGVHPSIFSHDPGPTNPSGLTLKFTYWEAVEELPSIRANSERSNGAEGEQRERERADMMGLMADRFVWNEPEKHISDVINK
jgi:hypothetical protein